MKLISKRQAIELIKSGRAEEVKATKNNYYLMGRVKAPTQNNQKGERKSGYTRRNSRFRKQNI